MIVAVDCFGRARFLDVGIDNGRAIELDGDLFTFSYDFLVIPLAGGLEKSGLCRDDTVN